MQSWPRWIVAALCVTSFAGCAQGSFFLNDNRLLPEPAPRGVQEEVRDSRWFLPLPDDSNTPPSGFQPPNVRSSNTSM